MDDDELLVTKNSAPLLVPQELLDDCAVNLLSWLANPHLRPAPRVLTRREKFSAWVFARRVALAERAYRVISGRDLEDMYWEE